MVSFSQVQPMGHCHALPFRVKLGTVHFYGFSKSLVGEKRRKKMEVNVECGYFPYIFT